MNPSHEHDADGSTGTRWRNTVAAAIPGLPFPLRKDRQPRAQYPAGLDELRLQQPSGADQLRARLQLDAMLEPEPAPLQFTVDAYVDGCRPVRKAPL